MFMCDVLKKEECRNETLKELRKLGIKCRPKKPKQQTVKPSSKIFKVPLQALPCETVTLKTGQQIAVPKLVHQMCSLILTKVSTEGLFRKEGSKVRQGEMKTALDAGGPLDKNQQIIDVAALLKTFLRDLPEPVIPYTHHELFLRCVLQDVGEFKPKALLLACLLLPLEHLTTLTYLLQFFYEVSQYSSRNKMNSYNLAVVIGPAIFPIEEKLSQATAQMRTTKICEIIQILIEHSLEVGILPENIIQSVASNAGVDIKKKKRRSGSLTRMFNGLKKIVGGKSVDENHTIVTPDLLLTPINNNIVKKRRVNSNGISTKKKKELLNRLPDNVLLSTPFTPRTPVSMELSGPQGTHIKPTNELQKEKKWFSRSRSLKNLKQEIDACKKTTTKTILERRWSAINPSTNLKRTKKRNSFAATSRKDTKIEEVPEPDYIRVPKTEYEAIKNRVSAMERRISLEIENVQCQITTENENNKNEEVDTNIQNVQTAYEQTLVQSAQLSPTTDHLAKRLSRELKIRRSADQKIIRSPSARKIGSMRRKSRELEKNSAKLTRHQSWHVAPRTSIPRVSLKRGKPNTVSSGLRASRTDDEIMENKVKTRSSSVGEQSMKSVSCNLSGSSDTWMSAEGFFTTLKSNDNSSNITGRSSLAQLRSQNAGMVLAKAKLFDKLSDSDSSNSIRSLPRPKVGAKIGASRNMDTRLSYRVRNLKYEERKLAKKSMSPRRRNGQLTQKHKIQIAKQFNSSAEKNSDKENIPDNFNTVDKNKLTSRVDSQKFSSPKYSTPRIPPHIKKSLNVRSPKRLCRTPLGVERGTPLRVLKTPRSNI